MGLTALVLQAPLHRLDDGRFPFVVDYRYFAVGHNFASWFRETTRQPALRGGGPRFHRVNVLVKNFIFKGAKVGNQDSLNVAPGVNPGPDSGIGGVHAFHGAGPPLNIP